MDIFIPTEINEDIVEAFARLMPQLSPDCQIPTKEYLEKIINADGSYLFIAKDEKVAGTLTLVIYQIPTGRKAWIEDVVVDSNMRGKGIAEKLIQSAIDFARKEGIHKLDLTSSIERQAAHALYKKMGFEERSTTVFRLLID